MLLPALGVLVVGALGVAVWSSTARPQPPSAPSSTADGAVPPAPPTGSAAVRTSVAHGSSSGYDATFRITETDLGAKTLAQLDVQLITEATPASAPSAHARLTAANGATRDLALTIVGAGRWTSRQFSIAPGRYTLSAQFDRSGAPVTIRAVVRLN